MLFLLYSPLDYTPSGGYNINQDPAAPPTSTGSPVGCHYCPPPCARSCRPIVIAEYCCSNSSGHQSWWPMFGPSPGERSSCCAGSSASCRTHCRAGKVRPTVGSTIPLWLCLCGFSLWKSVQRITSPLVRSLFT